MKYSKELCKKWSCKNYIKEEKDMKKLISSMLVVTMLTGSGILSYADTVDNSIDSTVFEENEVLEENSVFSNRYVYTEREEYLSSDSFTISEEEAATIRQYDSYLRNCMSVCLIRAVISSDVKAFFTSLGSPFIDKCLSKFYHSPYDAAGRYHVTIYSVKKIKKDLLKGTESVIRSGNRVEIEHDGKTVEFTGWE